MTTVRGPVAAADLGWTLVHEHLLWDLSVYRSLPRTPQPVEQDLAEARLSPSTAYWSRTFVFGNPDNLRQHSWQLGALELARFAALGGGTVVDVTGRGIGRDARGLAWISERSGLHIVAGTGYYVAASHPSGFSRRSVASIRREMAQDLTLGIGGGQVRAGVLGELGTSDPITRTERAVLEAAVSLQRELRVPMIVHPSPGTASLVELADVLVALGAIPEGVVLSHVDARVLPENPDTAIDLGRAGFMLGLDTFGRESWYEPRGVQLPSDAQRIQLVARLIDAGLVHRVLLSQDICFKTELTRYGGHGYAHLLRAIVPRLRHARVAESTIEELIVRNPARLLSGDWGPHPG